MNKRINWIDWAKFFAITMVVFGHIPEYPESALLQYVCSFHMPLFFFISGYLTKRRTDTLDNIKRHWHSLVIPYFLYNVIFYPYWLTRLILDNNGEISFYNIAIKPLNGVLLGQANTQFSCSVNGVTWFLAALLIMKIILNLCNRSKHSIPLMLMICLLSVSLYISDQYYSFTHVLLLKGLIKCIPFYILGYLLQHSCIMSNNNIMRCFPVVLIMFSISFLTFYAYLEANIFAIKITAWYITCITSIIAILFFCKLLDKIHHNIITTFSNGTIVIMGLHWLFIGTINYIIQHFTQTVGEFGYEWYTALLLSLLIDILLYPIIILFQAKMPWMLGKKNTYLTNKHSIST